MRRKEKILYALSGAILVFTLIAGVSYAYIKYETKEQGTNIVGTDCIKIEMQEMSDALSLQHAFPMTEETGKTTKPYEFKLINQCGTGVDYNIELEVEEVEEGNKIEPNNIAANVDDGAKVLLQDNVKVQNVEEEQERYKIGEGTLKPYSEVTHKVRIWLDESAGNDTQNKTFKSKVVIEATQNQVVIYSEEILHGADPVLVSNNKEANKIAMLSTNAIAEVEPTISDRLIPVTIDESNGTVTRADTTQEWYDYETKKWANAVILTDSATEPEVGAKIEEDQIESYFVWIPKYRYKLFNLTDYTTLTDSVTDKGPKTAIEIQFGLEDTIDDESNENYKQCKTPGTSGDKGQCNEGEWMTHPAFLAFPESKGFWVGKFETSNSNITSATEATKHNNDTESTNIIIKPNKYSWRNISLGNAFKTSKAYVSSLQSHMMKNTEWGAVAYLTNSIYGRCDKETKECTEVMLNNSSNYVTGVSAKIKPTSGWSTYKDYGVVTPEQDVENETEEFKGAYNYKTSSSNKASTTGNYSGIYDMSGGAWEYVAGYIDGQVGSSELTLTDVEEKYYDKYKNNTSSGDFSGRILGDATGEMGPFTQVKYDNINIRPIGSWFADEAWFVDSTSPWFARGGGYYDGLGAGFFASQIRLDASPDDFNGFRIVLSPQ